MKPAHTQDTKRDMKTPHKDGDGCSRRTDRTPDGTDISFTQRYSRFYGLLLSGIALVWLLPGLGRVSGWSWLDAFARMHTWEIPLWVFLPAVMAFAAAVLLEVRISLLRKRFGGCDDTHETVVVVRQGPYEYIRHPGHLAEMIYFGMLPILLSFWIPFTLMAMLAIVSIVVSYLLMLREEDRFNLQKWGKEYRDYMDSVPAINVVNGWWRIRNRTSGPY